MPLTAYIGQTAYSASAATGQTAYTGQLAVPGDIPDLPVGYLVLGGDRITIDANPLTVGV